MHVIFSVLNATFFYDFYAFDIGQCRISGRLAQRRTLLFRWADSQRHFRSTGSSPPGRTAFRTHGQNCEINPSQLYRETPAGLKEILHFAHRLSKWWDLSSFSLKTTVLLVEFQAPCWRWHSVPNSRLRAIIWKMCKFIRKTATQFNTYRWTWSVVIFVTFSNVSMHARLCTANENNERC